MRFRRFSPFRRAIAASLVGAMAALAPAQRVVVWGNPANELLAVPAMHRPVAISMGGEHALALLADGTVVGWGGNTYGQADVPTNLGPAISISAGETQSLAVRTDGTVRAWGGYSRYGLTDVPSGLNGVVQVSAGDLQSLALKSNGTVVGWGRGDNGEATPPDGLNRVIQIWAGEGSSFALKSNTTLVTWGGANLANAAVPDGLNRVVQVTSGYIFGAALKTDGTVVAWGSDRYNDLDIPPGLSGVVQIAAASIGCIALKSDGTVVHWGGDDGSGLVPDGLAGVVQIAAHGAGYMGIVAGAYCTLDQKLISSGGSATGTVHLANSAESGGETVGLASDDPLVHVPTSVIVPEGATTATFPVLTDGFVGDDHIVKLSTSYHNTQTVPFVLRLRSVALALTVSSPSVIGGSTGRPSLTATLPNALLNDLTLTLTSSDPVATLPASLTIAAGHTSARAIVGHTLTPTTKNVAISASANGTKVASASLSVTPVTAALRFAPASVEGGKTAVGTVTLNALLANPLDVPLSSSNSALASIPASVTIVAGAKSASFNAVTALVPRETSAVITATVNAHAHSDRLTIVPGTNLAALAVPTYGYGHATLTGTVKLSKTATTGGWLVPLTITGPISAPASVTVPAGSSTATFAIALNDVTATGTATVTAAAGAVTIEKTISVRPLAVTALALSATSVVGGSPVMGTVTVSAMVGVDTTISLVSDTPSAASVPVTVKIPAGSRTATFTISTTRQTAAKSVKITASKNGVSVAKTLKVTP